MQYAILQYDICPALGEVQGNQTAAGDGTQASRLRDSSLPTAAGEINGTQASRLRKSSLPTAAGETPAYQRESSLPTAAGEINGTQASRLRDSRLPSAAGEINGTQASRLRNNSLPTELARTYIANCLLSPTTWASSLSATTCPTAARTLPTIGCSKASTVPPYPPKNR